MKPAVSVVIPAYNVERYLAQALDSVRAQSLTNWEALVVNDGSTDETLAIAHRYAELDSRILVIDQQNQGVSAARNAAIEASRGEFIALLDGDDLWHPDKLEIQLRCLREREVDVVCCRFKECDSKGAPLPSKESGPVGEFTSQEFFRLCYSYFFILPSAVMVRSEALRRLGGFDSSLRAHEDFEMWLRLASGGCRLAALPDILLTYRRHPESLTYKALFEPAVQMLPCYSSSPWLSETERPKPYRTHFRNCFTYLGRLDQIHRAKAMFDQYYPFDSANLASRAMKLLRHLFPTYLFWFVSRFAIIPLAWHYERLLEKLQR